MFDKVGWEPRVGADLSERQRRKVLKARIWPVCIGTLCPFLEHQAEEGARADKVGLFDLAVVGV